MGYISERFDNTAGVGLRLPEGREAGLLIFKVIPWAVCLRLNTSMCENGLA